jgi:hypothetical protein
MADNTAPVTDRRDPELPAADCCLTALFLVESLLHGLVAQSVLSTDNALAIVRTAIEALAEVEHERGTQLTRSAGVGMLTLIEISLAADRS